MKRYPESQARAATGYLRPGLMNKSGSMLRSLGAGAAIMYFADPDRGRRRRALVRDKVVHAGNVARESVGKTARDVRNRATGVASGVKSLVTPDRADDVVVEGRVRARMGRIVSHPSAIHVFVEDGSVTLSGNVLSSEISQLVNAVRKVRGVRNIDNQLTPHESEEGIASLQGGSDSSPQNGAPRNWSPALRLASTVAGGSLFLKGLRRGGVSGALMGSVGAALASRAMLR